MAFLQVFDIKKGTLTTFKEKKRTSHCNTGFSCKGKVRHKSILAAQYYAENLQKESKEKIEIYKCCVCKDYHIGRSKNKSQR